MPFSWVLSLENCFAFLKTSATNKVDVLGLGGSTFRFIVFAAAAAAVSFSRILPAFGDVF